MLNKLKLYLFNTASRQKEEFVPLKPGEVKLYCCGPTVYHFVHIGNLRTFVFEDFLCRVLAYNGYQVDHTVNITDVGHLTSDEDSGEDKMEKGAAREGKTVWEVAEFYTQSFWKDWERLNLKQPSRWTKATDYIAEQIDLIQKLETRGFSYTNEDGVYFDTAKFPRYADFAKLDIDGLQAGARVEMIDGKRNATDFALWKFSPSDKQRLMEWESPWGKGFPGWHVECSAMALKHGGDTLDIHCGGTDLVRVHHTNEIAQSECATGHTFVRYWVHGEFLRMSADERGVSKMSKSTGNFLTLDSLLENGFSAMDYRYFCMTAHYRSFLTFSWESLTSAMESLRSLRKKTETLIGQEQTLETAEAFAWLERFHSALNDDLNFPQALAVVNQMLKDDTLDDREKAALIKNFDQVLGLGLTEKSESMDKSISLDDELTALVDERNKARAEKNFKRADEIRDIFKSKGLVLKDSPSGTTWEKA